MELKFRALQKTVYCILFWHFWMRLKYWRTLCHFVITSLLQWDGMFSCTFETVNSFYNCFIVETGSVFLLCISDIFSCFYVSCGLHPDSKISEMNWNAQTDWVLMYCPRPRGKKFVASGLGIGLESHWRWPWPRAALVLIQWETWYLSCLLAACVRVSAKCTSVCTDDC